jgi:hypothetical protein
MAVAMLPGRCGMRARRVTVEGFSEFPRGGPGRPNPLTKQRVTSTVVRSYRSPFWPSLIVCPLEAN